MLPKVNAAGWVCGKANVASCSNTGVSTVEHRLRALFGRTGQNEVSRIRLVLYPGDSLSTEGTGFHSACAEPQEAFTAHS